MTWDSASDQVRFYKDGVLAQAITDAADIAAPIDADDLIVGAWLTGGSHFDGLIDDLRIYNQALSASEVAAIFAPPASKTDVNGDGVTNVTDVQLAVNEVLASACTNADANGDGACNVADVQLIVNSALSGS